MHETSFISERVIMVPDVILNVDRVSHYSVIGGVYQSSYCIPSRQQICFYPHWYRISSHWRPYRHKSIEDCHRNSLRHLPGTTIWSLWYFFSVSNHALLILIPGIGICWDIFFCEMATVVTINEWYIFFKLFFWLMIIQIDSINDLSGLCMWNRSNGQWLLIEDDKIIIKGLKLLSMSLK